MVKISNVLEEWPELLATIRELRRRVAKLEKQAAGAPDKPAKKDNHESRT
jgi:hypothetical protein